MLGGKKWTGLRIEPCGEELRDARCLAVHVLLECAYWHFKYGKCTVPRNTRALGAWRFQI